jgi:hypothetical protein
LVPSAVAVDVPKQPFETQILEYQFPNTIAAKLAIADDPAKPLAKLSVSERAFIDQILADTLTRSVVLSRVRSYFRDQKRGEERAGW